MDARRAWIARVTLVGAGVWAASSFASGCSLLAPSDEEATRGLEPAVVESNDSGGGTQVPTTPVDASVSDGSPKPDAPSSEPDAGCLTKGTTCMGMNSCCAMLACSGPPNTRKCVDCAKSGDRCFNDGDCCNHNCDTNKKRCN